MHEASPTGSLVAVVAKQVKRPLINQEVGESIPVPVVTFAAALKSTCIIDNAQIRAYHHFGTTSKSLSGKKVLQIVVKYILHVND